MAVFMQRSLRLRSLLVGLSSLLLGLCFAASALAGPRIVQGALSHGFPEVGLLMRGASSDTRSVACSGTMIGCRTFLTAAHCVCLGQDDGADCQPPTAPDPARYHVFLQHGAEAFYPVSEIVVHPDYEFPQADLAVLTLARPVTGVTPARLSSGGETLGQAGTIVGFGLIGGNGPDIYGIKREGSVQTRSCKELEDDEAICWDFSGEGSNTCNGDSGGPLYFGSGAARRLAGVTSGGDALDCLSPDHSHDVNLFKYRPWILAQSSEVEGFTHCGAGPTAASDQAPIQSAAGELTVEQNAADHSFAVPENTAELRIGFNGREGERADFSFFVRQGQPATEELFDCAHQMARQSGVCVFEDPLPGPWYLAVQSFRGTGEYQFTAVTRAAVAACGDPSGDGKANASDALEALRAAVGQTACDISVCDVDGSGRVTASDALLVLRAAVGQVTGLSCPPSPLVCRGDC